MSNDLLLNFNFSENSLQFNPFYIKFLNMCSYYVWPSINGISALTSLLFFAAANQLKLKRKFYGYLKLKSLASMLISVILVFNFNYYFDSGCNYCKVKTFAQHFFEIYILRISINILGFITGNFWFRIMPKERKWTNQSTETENTENGTPKNFPSFRRLFP